MTPHLNSGALILLFAAAQGIFLTLILVTHPLRRRSLYLLAMLIFLFSLSQCHIALYWSRYLLYFPHFWAIPGAFTLLYGPLLYLYIQTYTTRAPIFQLKTMFHFIPFIAKLAYLSPLYLMSAETKRYILENYTLTGDYRVDFSTLLVEGFELIHLLVYLLVSAFCLKTVFLKFKNPPASKANIYLSWLKRLILGFAAFWSLWYVYTITMFFNVPYFWYIDYIITFSIAFFIYMIGYITLCHPELVSRDLTAVQQNKYRKSALPATLAEVYANRLTKLMECNSIYLNSNLTLAMLAEKLGLSSHHLSQVLNEKLCTNFFDFINQYRVNSARKKLLAEEHDHKTILGIALESGFNNKTSFNNAFKKHTGMTPSNFRKSAQKSLLPDKNS